MFLFPFLYLMAYQPSKFISAYYRLKLYNSLFLPGKSHYIQERITKAMFIFQTNEPHAFTEKYLRNCVFVDNFGSPNVTLFSPQFLTSFCEHARVFSKYCENVVF